MILHQEFNLEATGLQPAYTMIYQQKSIRVKTTRLNLENIMNDS